MANLTRRGMLQVVGSVAAGTAGTFVALQCRQGNAADRSAVPPQTKASSGPPPVGKADFPITPNAAGRRSHVQERFRLRPGRADLLRP